MTVGPEQQGDGPLAQPAGVAARVDTASLLALGLGTIALMAWALGAVWQAGGQLGAPLDDSYIHFQFARSFARFEPFVYSAGSPPVPGATSLLWPALLAPALLFGASDQVLLGVSWLLGFGALFGQASEVYLNGKRFLDWPFALAGGVLVLTLSANTWFAASAMEVVPLGYVLLRTARRAAEYAEGAQSSGRARELCALALAAALLRPEGALAALCVAAAFALSGRLLAALSSLCVPLVTPLINLLATGSAEQTTAAAKWLPLNPYFEGRLWAAVAGHLELLVTTLLDGREWAWTFIPQGYNWLALLALPALCWAAERGRVRVRAALLCVVGLGLVLPATYETFLVNRLRYLWPFSAPWLLGLAALGQLLGWALGRLHLRASAAGLLLPAFVGAGLLSLCKVSIADLAQSAAAISLQQVSLGKWAERSLPASARLGVNDAGAIAFYSGRATFDVVGLTTQGEARHWVAGPGSRFEHYERLPRAKLPTHFIVYPSWFGLPPLLGHCLTERHVEGATILGGPLMVACEAEYGSLGSGAPPQLLVRGEPLDELDVADLESEAAHAYELLWASPRDNVIATRGGVVDGGRAGRTGERFTLDVQGEGSLVVRLGAERSAAVDVWLGARGPTRLVVEPGAFQEVTLRVPEGLPRAKVAVALNSSAPLTLLHYWSFGPP
jgi:hypothetical protein